ncbi:MAG TPA: hypothetical protein VN306_03365 [Mycobacterium sp.]|nr:hypothetical protein [Mycobacterium sp.]
MVRTFPVPVLNSLGGCTGGEDEGSDEQADNAINSVAATTDNLALPELRKGLTRRFAMRVNAMQADFALLASPVTHFVG